MTYLALNMFKWFHVQWCIILVQNMFLRSRYSIQNSIKFNKINIQIKFPAKVIV